MSFSPFTRALAVAALVAASASPALAASEPSTKLVSCRSGSCLIVSGHRANASSVVLINDHAVTVSGQHNWQVSLPLDTVRNWSAPLARTIEVATFDPATQSRTATEANLPIGLLGHAELTSVVVAVK